MKGGKARPSRSIKSFAGKMPAKLDGAVAKSHFATAPLVCSDHPSRASMFRSFRHSQIISPRATEELTISATGRA